MHRVFFKKCLLVLQKNVFSVERDVDVCNRSQPWLNIKISWGEKKSLTMTIRVFTSQWKIGCDCNSRRGKEDRPIIGKNQWWVLLLMQEAAEQPVGSGQRSEGLVFRSRPQPRGMEMPCTKATGFWIRYKRLHAASRKGLKTIIPPASGYYIAVVAVNGTGNKHKQLTRAVLLAERVTANYFRHCSWCGLITDDTFWL